MPTNYGVNEELHADTALVHHWNPKPSKQPALVFGRGLAPPAVACIESKLVDDDG